MGLVNATQKIDLPWYEFLRAREDITDRRQVNWSEFKAKIAELSQERAAIVQQMARLFEG
jgi:hypothetical protein